MVKEEALSLRALIRTNLGGARGFHAPKQIGFCLDPTIFCMHGSRGCLACCSKSSPIIAVDEPSKGLRIQGRSVTGVKRGKGSLSEDLWSTSTYEMDNSAHQSQRSISSLSTAIDLTASSSNPNLTPGEFVNHGLILWNQTRQQWLANKKPQPSHPRAQHPKEPKLSWSATYESLLGTNKPFTQPIPLSEMVDFLVDVWEQEGMYD